MPSIFKRQGPEQKRQVGLHAASGLLAALGAGAMLAVLGLPLGGAAFLVLGALCGLGAMVNRYTYFSLVLHRGPVSISWAVVQTSAVVVAVLGWVVLNEPVRFWQPLGIACFLGCLALMAWAARRTALRRGGELAPRKGYWIWLLVSLFAGALGSFPMKFKERVGSPGHDLAFLAAMFAVGAASLLAVSRAGALRPANDRRTWLLAALTAVLYLGMFLLVLRGLTTCDAAVFFPVMAGVSVSFGVLWTILGGERPSRMAYVGAGLAVLSILLINLGGRPLLGGRRPQLEKAPARR